MPASKLSTIVEGTTKLIVPDLNQPKMIPGFFNPQGKFVRDVSIVCYNAYGDEKNDSDLTFADSLAGVGARGIRVANESTCFEKVYLNELNSFSLQLAKKSALANQVIDKCFFSSQEVSGFLSAREIIGGERFDVVDLDPFGTPSPFVDCLVRSVTDGGLFSVSATDSAVLCGVYPRVALRKYLGVPLRTDYCHEIGTRLIYGLLSMTAMRFETGIMPLFCHHDKHYFRAYGLLEVGNKYSIQNEERMGFVLHCFNCGFRTVICHSEFMHPKRAPSDSLFLCPDCSKSKLRAAGPLWIGPIQSQQFVRKCADLSQLSVFEEELDLPLYYDLSVMTDEMGITTPRIQHVIDSLRKAGRSASRTRLNPKAVRTDAPLKEIRSLLGELGR
jgi:tRNA (guanine26-N2/guanine27-N2)-dimethyltransferase